jgi:uncharacterized protein (TIGR03066 family)
MAATGGLSRPYLSPYHHPAIGADPPACGRACRGILGGIGMRTICAVALGICVVAFSGTARAQDDYAKKIVGTWVVEKAGGDLPAGSSIEFTKDGKLNAVVKLEGMELKLSGSYKLDKDKLTVKVKIDKDEMEETVTIKKLTDDTLEIEDKDKKVDVLKKKKEK